MTSLAVFLKYGVFALIAGCLNLASQRLILGLREFYLQFTLAILVGTVVGLVVKYLLDKHLIFRASSVGLLSQRRQFSLYVVVSIFTTGIFWGTEIWFWLWWETEFMREVGASIGLFVGYVVKYRLDKRFVFQAVNR